MSQPRTQTSFVKESDNTWSKRKFRFSRGPYRWWLVIAGVLTVSIEPVRLSIGAGMVVAGALLHFVCKAYLRQDQVLTVAGPYRFSRNPFYLANLLIDMGLLVIVGNLWVAIPFAVIWGLVYERTIAGEEATLARLFGDDFHNYCRAVPRLIPRPWQFLPASKVSGPRFSFRNPNIWGGEQFGRTFRILSYPLLLLAADPVRAWVLGGGYELSALIPAAGFVALSLASLLSNWLMARVKEKSPAETARKAA